MMPPDPRVALVIPAYNEAHLLPRLLDSVDRARERYAGGADAVEVIVADNGSTDATPAIARARGCVIAPVSLRSIGAARNGGARATRAPLLAFTDADSQVHPETFNAVELALGRSDVVAGATGMLFERWSAGLAVTWMLLRPMVLLMGLDGGVVFCRRSDWEEVGGYREDLLVAEDVAFLRTLKQLGRRRGQRFLAVSGAPATMSTRKFDKHGDWHMLRQMFVDMPLARLRGRARFEELLRRYWYRDR